MHHRPESQQLQVGCKPHFAGALGLRGTRPYPPCPHPLEVQRLQFPARITIRKDHDSWKASSCDNEGRPSPCTTSCAIWKHSFAIEKVVVKLSGSLKSFFAFLFKTKQNQYCPSVESGIPNSEKNVYQHFIIIIIIILYFQDSFFFLSVQPWLFWNMLCRPGWPRTHKRSRFFLNVEGHGLTVTAT